MPILREDLLSDPYGSLNRLHNATPSLVGSVVTEASSIELSMDCRLAPPLDLAPDGYPVEMVRIRVVDDLDPPVAFPLGGPREWLHRNPEVREHAASGSLCLWYPGDPDHLKWNWRDGFETFVQIVQRHLIGEEYWRREGSWPWPDAPHGERDDGRPHPLPGRLS